MSCELQSVQKKLLRARWYNGSLNKLRENHDFKIMSFFAAQMIFILSKLFITHDFSWSKRISEWSVLTTFMENFFQIQVLSTWKW